MPIAPHAAIADAKGATPDPSVLLEKVLQASAFDQQFKAEGGARRAVILVDLGAFETDSPTLPSRPMIESLVDRLAGLGWTDLALVSSSDASYTWCENRNVATLADLFGYQYQTSSGTPYDIDDLSENLEDAGFAPDSFLAGTSLSHSWLDADLRIIVAKAAIDQRHSLVLAANTLLAALPGVDRDRSYRLPMHAASVLSALLDRTPPDYCIVDLCGFAHGSGGRQIPRRYTGGGALVGGDDLLAVDMISAGKLGADPGSSDVWKALVAARGLKVPSITGSIVPLHDVQLADPLLVQSTRARDESEIFGNLFSPWLQRTDESLFPLKHAVDMSINAWAKSRLNDLDADAAIRSVLISLNWLAAYINYLLNAWCITNDKDRIRRRMEPVSPETLACVPADYEQMKEELDSLRRWLKARTEPDAGNLGIITRLDRAVIFEAARTYPVPFAEFVGCVDIAKSIQFMNDYIGGSVVVIARDALGRPLRQSERNIYLPQPNYLAWLGGKEIDVSKIEALEYGESEHQMHWKTIKSENRSATYDDGIVVFEAIEPGMTRVTLFGRQLFALPPVIEGMHLENQPVLEDFLTRLAYDEFFSKTFANFEALLDGRDVKIGVSDSSGRSPFEAPPRSIERIQAVALRVAELAGTAFEQFRPIWESGALNEASSHAGVTDEQGFRHFRAAPAPVPGEPGGEITPWSRLFGGYSEALTRDVAKLWKASTHRITVP